jgi:hypothetical protein
MKKLLFIILLLPFFAKAQTTYQLNYDSIRVNKTAGTGGTSLYGKVYLKDVTVGLSTDSGIVVRNGRLFKYPLTTSLSFGTFGSTPNAQGGSYSAGVITLQPASASFPGGVTIAAQGFAGLKTFNTTSATSGLNLNKTSNDVGIFGFQVSAVDKSFIEWNVNDGGSGVGTAFNIRNAQGAVGIYDNTNTGLKISGGNTVLAGTLSGTSATFTSSIRSTLGNDSQVFYGNSATTGYLYSSMANSVGTAYYGVNNNAGGGLGTGTSANSAVFGNSGNVGVDITTNATSRIYISNTGATTISNLSGTGSRMVVADANGLLATQAIPGGGGGSMTGVAVATANGFAGTSDGAAVVPTLTLTTSITGLLKGNGTAISAETTTGTGDVVRSTSPTLVTPALGTPSALVGTNITGTASGLTAGAITGQANSATITAATAATINTIALRDANGDITARTFVLNPAYGDFAPNKLVGTSAGGQIREMSQAQAQSYLGLGSNAYTSTAYAPLASPALTGTPTAPTQSAADNSTKIATTAYVDNAGTYKANLNSPVFTGTPVLPTGTTGVTQSASDNSTKLATTAYVDKFNLASGTYTPTLTNQTNVGSSTAYKGFYQRVGNIVTVHGYITVNPVAGGDLNASQIGISLPIASNLVTDPDLSGVVSNFDYTEARFVSLVADGSNDRAVLYFSAETTSTITFRYSFSYEVL